LPKKGIEEIRERMLQSAKAGITSAYKSEEYALIQAVNAYMETDKSYNLAYERLSEWYGIYYPEIRISSPESLAKLAIAMSNNGADAGSIERALGNAAKAEEVKKKAESTIGRKMEADEATAVTGFANQVLSTAKALGELDLYINGAAKRVMPNTTYLTDHMIAAELLSRAGSMERLATMPAGTVQLLGAEKALFKHIKFGSRPPKYGILFKLPEVTNAQREIKGRIARAYATKICIALKADYFSKNFIAEGLKKSLSESLKRIKEKPIKPKEEMRRDFDRGYQGKMQGRRGAGRGRGGWKQGYRKR
jgi:nucleolar protein 56